MSIMFLLLLKKKSKSLIIDLLTVTTIFSQFISVFIKYKNIFAKHKCTTLYFKNIKLILKK